MKLIFTSLHPIPEFGKAGRNPYQWCLQSQRSYHTSYLFEAMMEKETPCGYSSLPCGSYYIIQLLGPRVTAR
ncbi:UNVERIFIED_CONTAM: hypothetical protein K2H54_033480 [Gekko kuhli]